MTRGFVGALLKEASVMDESSPPDNPTTIAGNSLALA